MHISTAYSNADKQDVEEMVYPPPHDPNTIINCIDALPMEAIKHLEDKLLVSLICVAYFLLRIVVCLTLFFPTILFLVSRLLCNLLLSSFPLISASVAKYAIELSNISLSSKNYVLGPVKVQICH